jgi:hypothetical protein
MQQQQQQQDAGDVDGVTLSLYLTAMQQQQDTAASAAT